jgi:hypothetical protein
MYILYEGLSKFDGAPIVVIATKYSKNPKTGDMWQTFIMRSDVAPHDAIKTGDDSSVCGACPLRPSVYKSYGIKKKCYVTTFQSPLSVWNAYHRGSYTRITPSAFKAIVRRERRGVRLGSYGDPAAVPFELWQAIGIGSRGVTHTGYTHGWMLPNFDTRHFQYLMRSVDEVTAQLPEPTTPSRTFRVIADVSELRAGEISCPASAESGNRTTCAACMLCGGLAKQAKNIAIVAH